MGDNHQMARHGHRGQNVGIRQKMRGISESSGISNGLCDLIWVSVARVIEF
jgi:hypothetical protein